MNIIILDDYQDAVRKLKCSAKLEHLQAKVFTNNVTRASRRMRRGAALDSPRARRLTP